MEGSFRSLSGEIKRHDADLIVALAKFIDTRRGEDLDARMKQAFLEFDDSALWSSHGKSDIALHADPVLEPLPPDAPDPSQPNRPGEVQNNNQAQTEKDPWYLHTASTVKVLTPKLVNALLTNSTVIKNFIEWCDQPLVQ